MNLFDSRYYKLNRKLLSFIGLWPFQKPKDSRVRTFIVNFILTIAVITQAMNVFTLRFDVELLLSTSMFFLPYLCIVVIYYTAYANKQKLKFLTECIIADWHELKPEELKIVEKYATESRLLTRILIYSFYTPVVMMFILSAIPYISEDISSSKTHLPKFSYPVDVFIDKEKYPLIAILLVNLVIVTVGIISLANYTIFLVYVQHACAIFSVIGYILEHAVTEKQHDISRLIDSNEIYFKIVRGIRYHKRVVEFTEIINSFSEFCYLIQIVISLIILATDIMGILRMRGNLNSTSTTIICVIHMSSMICWLFFNCIIGQKVVDHSFIVFKKTCTIPWYLFPPRIQKLAIILLMRSAKPCYLSIGKMFVSSHEFFVTIIQTSVSYGMVLHSL